MPPADRLVGDAPLVPERQVVYHASIVSGLTDTQQHASRNNKVVRTKPLCVYSEGHKPQNEEGSEALGIGEGDGGDAPEKQRQEEAGRCILSASDVGET